MLKIFQYFNKTVSVPQVLLITKDCKLSTIVEILRSLFVQYVFKYNRFKFN